MEDLRRSHGFQRGRELLNKNLILIKKSKTNKFNFLLKRIPAAAVPVSTMAHVKLDTPVKDFVVNVLLDSLAHFAKKVNQKKNRWVGGKYTLDNCFYFVSACSLDFEDGIGGWERTGTAFDNQPTFGDNPKARNRESAKQQGNWWIGGAELRPKESVLPGKQPPDADLPQGTLTSPCFQIVGHNISFLIGGGCELNEIRAELIVNNKVGISHCIMRCNISLPVFFLRQHRYAKLIYNYSMEA